MGEIDKVLTMVKDSFDFTSINYPFYEKDAILICQEERLDEYVQYIRDNQIESAEIVLPNLEILQYCPSLRYIKIHPSSNSPVKYDFSPLYQMQEIKHLHTITRYYTNNTGKQVQHIAQIDYSKIKGLVSLSLEANRGALNFNSIPTLKSLDVGGFQGKFADLTDLFCSEVLDTLSLTQCKVESLNGIGQSKNMQCLYLRYNRSLKDITALGRIKDTLKCLVIDHCPNIDDFSFLGELSQLEELRIYGNNKLPSLSFLSGMPNLKKFVFDVNVLDGDLSPCMNIPLVYSLQNRKHYTHKNADLPKNTDEIGKTGNAHIEEWRRLE